MVILWVFSFRIYLYVVKKMLERLKQKILDRITLAREIYKVTLENAEERRTPRSPLKKRNKK